MTDTVPPGSPREPGIAYHRPLRAGPARRGFVFREDTAIRERDHRAGGDDALASLTHARVRAGQGDVAGARAVLEAVLRREPGDARAAQLMAALDDVPGTGHAEPDEEPTSPPEAADPSALRSAFRSLLAGEGADRRLRRWAETIARNRGGRRDAR